MLLVHTCIITVSPSLCFLYLPLCYPFSSWYFGHISCSDSVQILSQVGIESGTRTFLIRDSESSPGVFTLSVRRENTIDHYHIMNAEEGMNMVVQL